MELQVCIYPSLENIPCAHLFVVPECHSAGYWNGVREKGNFLFSLFCFKSQDKLPRVVTGIFRSCLHVGTMSLLLPLLFALSNLTSSYYFPVYIYILWVFFAYILPSQATGCRFRENETLKNLKGPVTLEIVTLPNFSGPLSQR